MAETTIHGHVPLTQFMSSDGVGGGTLNYIGNHPNTQVRAAPPQGERWVLDRLIVHIEDARPFNADNYGGLGGPLTNGVRLKLYDADGEALDLTGGVPVLSNNEWSRVCHNVNYIGFGAGLDALSVQWLFSDSGESLRLDGDLGDYLAIELNDDFTGLNEHYFMIQGYKMLQGISYT